jgi:hypothetical protein
MPSHTGEHSVYVALLYNVSNILVPWRCVHTSRKRREKLKLLCLGVKFMTLSARSDFKPSSTRGSSRGSTCLWCSRPINRKLLIRPRTNPVFEHFENQIVYGWRRPHRDENCTLASHSWVYFCFVIVTCVSRQTRERKKNEDDMMRHITHSFSPGAALSHRRMNFPRKGTRCKLSHTSFRGSARANGLIRFTCLPRELGLSSSLLWQFIHCKYITCWGKYYSHFFRGRKTVQIGYMKEKYSPQGGCTTEAPATKLDSSRFENPFLKNQFFIYIQLQFLHL